MSVAPLQLLKSEFNPLVYVALDNATDKYVSLAYYYGETGTTPSDAYFTKGALLVQATDGTTYQNTAEDGDTPTWGILGGGGGGGIAIGDTVTGADKRRIMFLDGDNKLTQDSGFTRQVDGQTLFSSTFGTDIVSYSMDSDLFSTGVPGIGIKIQNAGGEVGRFGFASDGGDLVNLFQIDFTDTSKSSTVIGKNSYELAIKGTTNKQSDLIITDVSTELSSSDASNTYGTKTLNGVTTLGKTSGSFPTKVIVDAINSTVTVTNVTTYADDAAAATDGLTSGMLYKTTTGGITALNIVP